MIYILISALEVGQNPLWEKLGKKGRCKAVSTYRLEIWDTANPGQRFFFSVTRDSSRAIFDRHEERYLSGGECPPNKTCTPYRARLHKAKRNGWSLMVYEENGPNDYSLRGQGMIERTNILIHAAKGSSAGCMGIAGGPEEWKRFLHVVQELHTPNDEIMVIVEPRSPKDQDEYLIHQPDEPRQ